MKRKDLFGDKQTQYTIRKLSVGVASVATGVCIFLHSPQVFAEEVSVSPATTAIAKSNINQVDNRQSTNLKDDINSNSETVVTPSDMPDTKQLVSDETDTQKGVTEPDKATSLLEENKGPVSDKNTLDLKVAPSTLQNTPDKTSQAIGAPSPTLKVANQAPQIENGYFRLHLKELPQGHPVESTGLWIWGDVDQPSSNWPNGAIPMTNAKKDDYGYYVDFKLSEKQRKQISFLINNKAGTNLSGDHHIPLLRPEMNQVWIDEKYGIHTYQPLKEGYVRINYLSSSGNYDHLSAWLFKDVATPSTTWPDGSNFVNQGLYGRYIDVPLKTNAKEIGFLILDESKTGDAVKVQPNDYVFRDLANHNQIFVKDKDPKVYNNPYYIDQVQLKDAQQTDLTSIQASFTTLDGVDKTEILKELKVTDKNQNAIQISDITLDTSKSLLIIKGDFNPKQGHFNISYNGNNVTTRQSWEFKDQLYAYSGNLGAVLNQDGSKVEASLWSPSADSVTMIIYDKDNQNRVVATTPLVKNNKGVWQTILDTKLGIKNYTGYYYLYEIKRGKDKVKILDPYAKSLAEWDSNTVNDDIKTAKAAFVNPSQLGPQNLSFAKIANFKGRQDAVIYEAHVRDFTSDQSLDGKLKNQFVTFAAFSEKLDYLQKLGVTHIQLLPVLSYFYVNEMDKSRSTAYTSSDNNYNWGYDPQSYFALSGMYSEKPKDPSARIAELKQLIHDIHKRGMGVILDVVYNHTAKTYLFEDIEPNYYHFMNEDGSPRESFGGGRLGTTHAMSRRVLVDSIKYLTSEFKVDGFRFDMMGDHDAAAIELAYKEAKAINPNMIMIGEGWRTFQGDQGKPVKPADQDWMKSTDTVGVFSDDIRNSLKSGFPNEGTPAFITGGPQSLQGIFKNIKAQPGNFEADSPGDVVQYIAAHDNLTLHDVIAKSINKDPKVAEEEIHRRLRLGNVMILTSQGTAFIHSGQEYGRTKRLLNPDYMTKVSDDKLPNKATLIEAVKEYPYFIHDSYDSSDAINHFDWAAATDNNKHPISTKTQAYTAGLITLRRSTDAFRKLSKAEIDREVSLITEVGQGDIKEKDLVIAYQTIDSKGDIYAVFVNADSKARNVLLGEKYKYLLKGQVIVDADQAGIKPISTPRGVHFEKDSLLIDPLTAIVIKVGKVAPSPKEELQADYPKTQSFKGSKTVEKVNRIANKTSITPVVSNKTDSYLTNEANLPKTGDKSSKILSVVGISILASLLALLGLSLKRNRHLK